MSAEAIMVADKAFGYAPKPVDGASSRDSHSDTTSMVARISCAMSAAALAIASYTFWRQTQQRENSSFCDRKSFSIIPSNIYTVATKNASPAGGHYSQAVCSGNLLFVSGILPITPDGEKLSGRPFVEQAETVLSNLEAIIRAGGSSLDKTLKVTVYIADIEKWGAFNKLYAAKFGSHKPARAVVPVPHLHYNLELELAAIATL
jgi:2-iminobutanoate/2-iminopropanoate deaminase